MVNVTHRIYMRFPRTKRQVFLRRIKASTHCIYREYSPTKGGAFLRRNRFLPSFRGMNGSSVRIGFDYGPNSRKLIYFNLKTRRRPMGKRFFRSELFEIRNAVSIDRLIAEELDLPLKTSDGRPRFLCPVCNEFQTATNPSTNLGRCFRCEKIPTSSTCLYWSEAPALSKRWSVSKNFCPRINEASGPKSGISGI